MKRIKWKIGFGLIWLGDRILDLGGWLFDDKPRLYFEDEVSDLWTEDGMGRMVENNTLLRRLSQDDPDPFAAPGRPMPQSWVGYEDEFKANG